MNWTMIAMWLAIAILWGRTVIAELEIARHREAIRQAEAKVAELERLEQEARR